MSCGFRDPGNEIGIVTAGLCAGTTGDDQSVDRTANFRDGSCIGEYDATIGLKSSFQTGVRKLNFITGRIGKDLQWPRYVQNLNRRRPDDDYSSHIDSVSEVKRLRALHNRRLGADATRPGVASASRSISLDCLTYLASEGTMRVSGSWVHTH
jgi:hypothetical protein